LWHRVVWSIFINVLEDCVDSIFRNEKPASKQNLYSYHGKNLKPNNIIKILFAPVKRYWFKCVRDCLETIYANDVLETLIHVFTNQSYTITKKWKWKLMLRYSERILLADSPSDRISITCNQQV
jgi:hypothetical protein